MNFSRKKASEDVRIDLTSLIDVVFLLIIFFMVTTTFQARSGISVKLPEAESSMPPEQMKRVVISIRADGAMFLGDKSVDDKALAARLKAIAGKSKTLVVIRADKSVLHGRVVRVMDIARTAGLTRLAIATVRGRGT